MNAYYLLLPNPMGKHAFGIAAGPDSLDPVEWMHGKKLKSVPNPIVLTLHAGSGATDDLADIAGGLYTVFSKRLQAALGAAGVDNVDYYPARLVHPTSGQHREDFVVANVLGLVSAVDASKSTISPGFGKIPGTLRQFTVDDERVRDLHLFRLRESPRLIVVDVAVKSAVDSANLDGVFLQPTQEWTGTNSGPRRRL